MNLILASQSSRRRDILENLGLDFEVVVSKCEEDTNKTKPGEIVMDLSMQKAMDVLSQVGTGNIIIAADTIVYFDGKVLGKPKSEAEAFKMLSALQNSWHTVYTGVTVIFEDGQADTYYERADVHMSAQTDEKLNRYIATGKPMDKAGSYGIQDDECDFVDEIKGEIDTVIGLPTKRLKQLLL